jgi:hypothetical protein
MIPGLHNRIGKRCLIIQRFLTIGAICVLGG